MNKKSFSLIEVVVVIITLTILLSVVLVNLNDLKKKSVHSAVSMNVKILQNSVDEYYLKNERYPTKGEVNLNKPILIDVDKLVKEGYIKKEVNLDKIKSQYYWLDVFGKVWGATRDYPTNSNVIRSKGSNFYEFTIEKDITRYNIYEVNGFNSQNISYKDISIQKPEKNVALADEKKYYRLVASKEVNLGEPMRGSYVGNNASSTYLISFEDEYGLESAPVGLNDNSYFNPLYEYEGTREYEIEGSRTMYWIDFYTVENKPEGSSITYKFKVKQENGEYGEWTEDFYSLPPSNGIIVEVTMIATMKNKKPSLYDLRILYDLDKEDELIVEPFPILIPNDSQSTTIIEPKDPFNSTTEEGDSGNGSGGGTGGSSGGSGSGSAVGSFSGGNKYFGGGSSGSNKRNPLNTCPAGYQTTYVGSNSNNTEDNRYSYLFLLEEGYMLEQLIEPIIKDTKIVDTMIQYSTLDGESGYLPTMFLKNIPSGSCVNVVYTTDSNPQTETIVLNPPFIQKKPTMKVSIDEYNEWTTIDQINFVGNSLSGKPVKWSEFIKEDYTPENTRVVYEFSHISNGRWSTRVPNVTDLPQSRSVMATAFLQVKTSELNNLDREDPEVLKMKFIHSEGEVSYDKNKPTLVINPVKNNNKGTEKFSTSTIIKWETISLDPKKKEIVKVEWAGDRRENYNQIGNYNVKARVQNSDGLWSDWASYEVNVFDEMPVAKFVPEKAFLSIGEKVDWNNLPFDESYDPDEDGPLTREWKGERKDIYKKEDLGEITVEMRVRDAEGNYSEWITQKVVIDENLIWTNIDKTAFDNDMNTNHSFNKKGNIYWVKELSNRKVTMNFTTLAGSGNTNISILNKDGKRISFINPANNNIVTSISIPAGTSQREYSIIIPEEGYSIFVETGSFAYLNEITVDLNGVIPDEVKNVKATPDFNKINLTFDSKGLKTHIYREDIYLGETTNNQFSNSNLISNTLYTYSLQTESKEGHRSKIVSISAKTLERDITFYSKSNVTDLSNLFDYNEGTLSSYSHTYYSPTITVNWKAKEGFNFPTNINGKVLKLRLRAGTANASEFRVVDENNNNLNFHIISNNQLVNTNNVQIATAITDYYVILPQNAKGIKFSNNKAVSGTSYLTYFYDIRFSSLKEVSELQDVQYTPSYTSVTMSWTKSSDTSYVDVFRNGVYIGTSSSTSFTDPAVLESGKTYTYQLAARNSENGVKWMPSASVKTLERDITFYSTTTVTNLLNLFDYNESTSSSYSHTAYSPTITVNWKEKDGADSLSNIEGKVLRLRLQAGTANASEFRVVDSKNSNLPFHIISNNQLTNTTHVQIATGVNYYYVVLPKNATGIKFSNNKAVSGTSYLTYFYDIRFTSLKEVSELQDVKYIPNYTNTTITWTKASDTSYVDVFRNGGYIGTSSGTSFTDPATLESGKTYTYQLAVRNSENGVKWMPTTSIKTLERDITFYSTTNVANLVNLFDYNPNTFSTYSHTAYSAKITVNWRVKEGIDFPSNGAGKILKLRLRGVDSTSSEFRVVNANNSAIQFKLKSGDTFTTVSKGSVLNTVTDYYIELPEGAAGIMFSSPRAVSGTSYALHMYDIRFVGYN